MVHGSAATPRQRRRQANLERILDGAMQLVIGGGFDALSMHRLARELDYTPGALYRYYDSKDVLIGALTARVLEGFTADLEATLAGLPADAPLLRVAAGVFAYRDLARRAPHRFGMLSMLAAEPRMLIPEPDDAAPALTALTNAMTPLAAAFQVAADLGELDDGDARNRTLITFGATHGLLQLRKQENRVPGIIDLDALVAQSLRTLLVGWGADPALADAQITLASKLSGDPS